MRILLGSKNYIVILAHCVGSYRCRVYGTCSKSETHIYVLSFRPMLLVRIRKQERGTLQENKNKTCKHL